MAHLSDTIIFGDLGIKGVLSTDSEARFAGDVYSKNKKVVLSDGTNASGTWGISISGNAATATNATNATNASTAAKVANALTMTYGTSNSSMVNFNGSAVQSLNLRNSGDLSLAYSSGVLTYGLSGLSTQHTHLNSVYADCTTAVGTAAKTVAYTNYKLNESSVVNVKFTNGSNVADATLNINNTGAKPIKYKGVNLTSSTILKANQVYSLVYDGTNYNLIGDLDAQYSYSHPSHTAKGLSLYKIEVNGLGHVINTAAVTAADLPKVNSAINADNAINATNAVNATNAANVGIGTMTAAPFYLTGVKALSGNQPNFGYNGLFVTPILGTTSVQGYSDLSIGNATKTGAADNAAGRIKLYGTASAPTTIVTANNSDTATTITLPNASGTVSLTSHTHGNITSGGAITATQTIASGDRIAIVDASDSSKLTGSGITFGSTATQYLNNTGAWSTPPDTKNTSGSTDTSSKIFLVGATSQAANPQTYSHDTAYVGTDGCLYSGSKKVATEEHVASAISSVMIFKGTIGTGGNITELPTTNVKIGDSYRVIAGFTGVVDGKVVEVGDLIIAVSNNPITWSVVQNNLDSTSLVNSGDALADKLKGKTPWSLFYVDGSNVIKELGPGTNGQFLRSNGSAAPSWGADNNTDTKVTNTLATTTKAYLTATSTPTTNTGTQVFDTGVYLGTGAGTLHATTFYGALSGNATTATKLGTANVGSNTQAIHLVAGAPTVCTGVLENSISGNAATATTATTALSADVANTVKVSTGAPNGVINIPYFDGDGNKQPYNCNGLKANLINGSTTTTGTAELFLGNELATNTANNYAGAIRMYGTSTGYTTLKGGYNSTSNITVTLPASAGTLALNNQTMYIGTTSVAINRGSGSLALTGVSIDGNAGSATKLTSTNVGSATAPVYFSDGKPVVCGATLGVSITGNAATATSATKLATARTLWGQSFNGEANVNGDITISGAGAKNITIDSTDANPVGILLNRTASDTHRCWQVVNDGGMLNMNHKTKAATTWANILSLSYTGASITGTLGVSGVVSLNNATDATSTTAAGVKIVGGLGIAKQLRVGGAVTIGGATSMASFTASGNGSITGTLGVTGATTLTSFTASSNGSITGTLGVSGVVSLNNATDATSTTAAGVKITGGLGIAKQLRVGGAVTIGGATSMASFTASSNGSITGTLAVGGVASLNNATDATSTTAAGVKIAGGLGIVKQLRVGSAATFGSTVTATGNVKTSGSFLLGDNVEMKYNSTNKSVQLIFK